MSFIHAGIHIHTNDSETSGSQRESANQIAVKYLDAFGLPWETTPSGHVAIIGSGFYRDAIGLPASGRTDLYTAFECQTQAEPGGLVQEAAFTEIAIELDRRGLINRHCNLLRWHRHLRDRHWEQQPANCRRISRAMDTLGLPLHGDRDLPEPDLGHRRCATAAQAAREMYDAMENPWAALLLFGSRGRGNHRRNSGTDVLVETGARDQATSHRPPATGSTDASGSP